VDKYTRICPVCGKTFRSYHLKQKTCSHKCGKPLNNGRHPMSEEQRIVRFWSFVSKPELDDGCWEWQMHLGRHGYGEFYWRKKTTTTHRLVWYLTNGDIPEGMQVCHTCDNRSCCNPAHLFLGTNKDNCDDKVKKGRQQKGAQCHMAKLSESDVITIRNLHASGGKYKELALAYGVSAACVQYIVSRKTWKHIP
jgi:predicted nucleic acid-binding Zn ribbon protein